MIGVTTIGLRMPARALFWCARQMERYVYYYGVVRAKRYVLGEPAWQSHDLSLGIGPPPGTMKDRPIVITMPDGQSVTLGDWVSKGPES